MVPPTFKDEADVDASRERNPVASAQRSKAALDRVQTRNKVQKRILTSGTRPINFGRLLARLGAVVRNTMRPKGAKSGEATFTLTTTPR